MLRELERPIDAELATALLTGIVSKTRSFKSGAITGMLVAGLALMFVILVLAFDSFRFTTFLLSIVPLSLIGREQQRRFVALDRALSIRPHDGEPPPIAVEHVRAELVHHR